MPRDLPALEVRRGLATEQSPQGQGTALGHPGCSLKRQVLGTALGHPGCSLKRQVLGAGALGRASGGGWGGRWEGGSGWGAHVNPWLIHVNVWQKPLQYYKVVSLQLVKKI